MAAGERALGPEAFQEYAAHFWGILETRPYMRAREGLAQCLAECGRREEAAEHYREMLRQNPNDNQGVRWSLATLLLDLNCDDELNQLLARYEDDSSAHGAFTKALAAFRQEGDSPWSLQLLMQAAETNPHVAGYLLGHKPLTGESPPYITLGGDDEAAVYALANRRAWLNTPARSRGFAGPSMCRCQCRRNVADRIGPRRGWPCFGCRRNRARFGRSMSCRIWTNRSGRS